MSGTLYIVATPIGNLQDITYRAVSVLNEVNLIAAEDTRHSKKLCDHYEIKTPITSYHSHNQDKKTTELVAQLQADQNIALISDAGTPGICDPGFNLVQAVLTEFGAEAKIEPIPGASALTTALSVSGFPMHNFLFLGFFPIKKGRQTLIESIKEQPYTIIFYESVHRIQKTLKQLEEAGLGDRQICIARELTKQHETFYRGTVAQLANQSIKLKGEFTCLLAPPNFSR